MSQVVVNPENNVQGAVIVDLGKKRRKQVRDLRKGRGKLMDKVSECLDELKASGTLKGDARPVIVIVERKARSGFPF